MKFKVEKMMCNGCVSNVQSKLDAIDGVKKASVDLESGSVEINGNTSAEIIIKILSAAGYPTEQLTD